MTNVVDLAPSPLGPFLGKWIRDPLSVSRNKVARRLVGAEGFKRLWACGSIDELRRCLASDPELARDYQACDHLSKGRLVIAAKQLTWVEEGLGFPPGRTTSQTIAGVRAEGRKVIVRSSSAGRQIEHVLRMRKEWLLVSEQYLGERARLFPRSPVFRYYRDA